MASFVSRMQSRIDYLTDMRDKTQVHADFVDPLIRVRIALDEFLLRDPIAGDFSSTDEDLNQLGQP